MIAGTAIARHYPAYIDAFTKAVAEAQERIKKLEGSQAAYLCARDFLAKESIENDVKLKLTQRGADIEIIALPTDTIAGMQGMVDRLTQAMVDAGIRKADADAPNAYVADWDTYANWTIYASRMEEYRSIEVYLRIPQSGTPGIEVTRHDKPGTIVSYHVRDRGSERPFIPATEIPF